MLLCRTPIGRLVTIVLWVAVGVLFPLVWGTDIEHLSELDFIVSLVLVGVGLNIALGYAGLVFLGPGALFAIGGYSAALVAVHFTSMQNLWLMCLSSVAVSVALAAVIAALTLRVGGFYLGMVTLFISLVVPGVVGVSSNAGAAGGLSLVAVPSFVQRPSGYALYLVGVGMVTAVAGYSWAVRTSRLGRRLGSIMASEDMAQSIGIALYWTKLWSLLLAAIPIGLAGGFYVYSQQFISPDSVTLQTSIYVIAGVVAGGTGTILGPIIGVSLIGIAIEQLSNFNQYEGLLYGTVLILVAVLMPRGLIGLYRDLLTRLKPQTPVLPPITDVLAVLGLRHAVTATGTPSRPADAGSAPPTTTEVPGRRVERVAPGGATGGSPPLTVQDARRHFGGVAAVDGVDLVVERGQVHAIIGPNGSGKTTLLNLITGYYALDAGTISIGSTRLDTLRGTVPVARFGVARTFQTPKLNPFETAMGNVLNGADQRSRGMLVGTLFHTRRARADDRLAIATSFAVLNDVGLFTRSLDLTEMVPHGTLRLLEISRAMAADPMFVLLDEPAAGLSLDEAENLKAAVRTMARAGLGVLIVEHNLPVVFDIADVVTVLDEGRVISRGTPDQVSRDPEVIRVYIGSRNADAPGP